MTRLIVRTLLHLVGNALGLIVAAAVLDKVTIDASAFLIAVAIFTVVEVLTEPLFRKIALKKAEAFARAVALVSTFVGLLVTDIVSDGLSIEGGLTWLSATLIVWGAATLAGFLLSAIFLKKAVDER